MANPAPEGRSVAGLALAGVSEAMPRAEPRPGGNAAEVFSACPFPRVLSSDEESDLLGCNSFFLGFPVVLLLRGNVREWHAPGEALAVLRERTCARKALMASPELLS